MVIQHLFSMKSSKGCVVFFPQLPKKKKTNPMKSKFNSSSKLQTDDRYFTSKRRSLSEKLIFAHYLLEANKHFQCVDRETESQHIIELQSQKLVLLELALKLRGSSPPVIYPQTSFTFWTAGEKTVVFINFFFFFPREIKKTKEYIHQGLKMLKFSLAD